MQSFERYQHRNNNYIGLCKYGRLMRLDFRKVFENGKLIGFHHVEISISPHYHFNNYQHNGNDFTPENCIKTILDILTYLRIKPHEYSLLKIVNIEFGLNIVPEMDIKSLINWILYSKKTSFVVPNSEIPYFKITNTTKYKQIKAYAKGLHCHEVLNAPEIDANTFRFEIKSKKSANIKKYGIDTAIDLFKPETYQRLAQEIIAEWEHILLINKSSDFSGLKKTEVEFIQKTNEKDFWRELITEKHRNTFGENKVKYYKLLSGKGNLHTKIKGQIIDKLIDLQKCAYFSQGHLTNKGNLYSEKSIIKEING